MMFPKVKPLRSKRYRLFVASKPCCMPNCGSRYGVIPHHSETGGMSTKCGDDLCVPLCFFCHEEMDNKRKDDIPDRAAIIKRLRDEYNAIH